MAANKPKYNQLFTLEGDMVDNAASEIKNGIGCKTVSERCKHESLLTRELFEFPLH